MMIKIDRERRFELEQQIEDAIQALNPDFRVRTYREGVVEAFGISTRCYASIDKDSYNEKLITNEQIEAMLTEWFEEIEKTSFLVKLDDVVDMINRVDFEEDWMTMQNVAEMVVMDLEDGGKII